MEAPNWSPTDIIVRSEATNEAYVCQNLEAVDHLLRKLHAQRNGNITMARWILLTDDVDLLLEVRQQIQNSMAETVTP